MPAYHARVAMEAHNTGTGALIISVLHLEVDTLTSPPNWQSIADDIYTWLGQPWRNILTVSDTFDQVVVTDENYPGSTHGQGVHVATAAGVRTLNDSKLDPAMCILVSWPTAVAKRYARGHTFMPPAYDSAGTFGTGSWNTAGQYYTAVNTFAQTYNPGHTAGSTSYIPEIFSRHQVNAGLTPFSFPIKGYRISAKQHWLRSRSTAP